MEWLELAAKVYVIGTCAGLGLGLIGLVLCIVGIYRKWW